MKTQSVGWSMPISLDISGHGYSSQRQMQWTALMRRVARENYIGNHMNYSLSIDLPSQPYPFDGTYSDWIEAPLPGDEKGYYRVRYDEGPKDREWVQELDRNALSRLAHSAQWDEFDRMKAQGWPDHLTDFAKMLEDSSRGEKVVDREDALIGAEAGEAVPITSDTSTLIEQATGLIPTGAGAGAGTGASTELLSKSLRIIPYADIHLGETPHQLGSGGFGAVFRALWAGTEVAVKILTPGLDMSDTSREQLVQEAGLMYQFNHPNILQLRGICVDHPAMVYKFMKNGSLKQLLLTPMSWDVRLKIATGIAAGLHYLHRKKFVHGHLKTDNVLLNKHFKAKLTSFGLAKIRQEAGSSSWSGTYAWSAPETLTENVQNAKSDLYALGTLLWSIATKKEPHAHAKTQVNVVARIAAGKHEPISNEPSSSYATSNYPGMPLQK